MRAKMRISLGVLVVILIGAIGIVGAVSGPLHAGPQADGKSGVTTNGWLVTPAGDQVTLGDRPYGLAVSPDGKTMVVTNNGQSTQSLQVVDLASGKVVQTIPYITPESLFIGVAFSPSGKKLYASAGGNNKIRVFDVTGQHLEELVAISLATTGADGKTINHYPAGLTVSPDGKMLYAAANMSDSLAMIDLSNGKATTVAVGHNPYTAAITTDGKKVYVSNWGSNTLSVIDPSAAKVLSTITVGQHPNALAWAPGGKQLFVSNGDSDTISIVDPATDKVTGTVDLAPYANAKQGANPNALTVSADGKTLYVANALDNDVAVVDLATNKQLGLIPTGWYPTGVALQGDNLYVLNAKGLGAGPNNNPGPSPYKATTPPNQYVGSMIPGTLSIIPKPSAAALSKYTDQVWSNNDFAAGSGVRGTDVPQQVIPHRVGDSSPIKHVIYIVKENRTYDQVFGDLGKGAGDPSLALFNDDSAPNLRALARQYVTLDNFYANAEVSADGWNWSTAAEANTYVQKTWPANYSSRNRPYDFEGGNASTAPNRRADQSYLWNLLDAANVNYRNYGFWANGTAPYSIASTEPGLAAHSDTNYPGYNLDITDQTRVEEWLKEFKTYESAGTLPTFQFVRLPNDHTAGTSIGKPTPKAMVADNDLAVGRLVEAVSSSKFWADTAIFIVEDDAQNGPDHIDAHRTEALVVSPYTQTGQVDSTFYSTASMLRTMELIVGIAPLTQFDTAAMPMARSFTNSPKTTPFKAITPKQSLTETNTALSPMALVSASQDLSVEDRINEQAFNQAIWASVKGASVPMPAPQHNLGLSTQTTGTDADG